MTAVKDQKPITLLFLVVNFVLFFAYLNQGHVTENQRIHNTYLLFVYVFLASLSYCIYYKQHYKTFSFWLTIVVSIVFVLVTCIYWYISALGSASWR